MLACDEKLKDVWSILNDAEKAEFIAKGHEFMGKELKKMLESTISETVCKSMKKEFEAHGDYQDKEFFEKSTKINLRH